MQQKQQVRIYPKIQSNIVIAASKKKMGDFAERKKEVTEIYSYRGVFEIVDGRVCRIKHRDGPTDIMRINGVEMIIDTSDISKEDDFQFPRSHTSRVVERTQYKISKKSTVVFVIETVDDEDDEYVDYYFMTDNYDQAIHQMDIIEFLNIIKLY